MTINRLFISGEDLELDLIDISFKRIVFDQKHKEFFVLGTGVAPKTVAEFFPFSAPTYFIAKFDAEFSHLKTVDLESLGFEDISDMVIINGQIFLSGSAEAVIGVDEQITTFTIVKLSRKFKKIMKSVYHHIMPEGYIDSHMTVNERDSEPVVVINYDDAPNSEINHIVKQVILRIDPVKLDVHNSWDCEIPESYINRIACEGDRIILAGTTLYMGEPLNPIVSIYGLHDTICSEKYDVCLDVKGEFIALRLDEDNILLGGFRIDAADVKFPLVLGISAGDLRDGFPVFESYEDDLNDLPGKVLGFASHQGGEQGILFSHKSDRLTSRLFWTQDDWMCQEYENLEVLESEYQFDDELDRSICIVSTPNLGDRMFITGGYLPDGARNFLGMIREIEF